jgi:hypothetical protein
LSKSTLLEIIPVHLFLKHRIPVDVNVEGTVLIVSSMIREKKADISRASLGMCFGRSPESSWEWGIWDMYILIVIGSIIDGLIAFNICRIICLN